jgi:two-component system, cell cycle sensor histidine kinase and response regulator CckA
LQILDSGSLWVLLGASLVLFLFAAGYVLVTAHSNQKIREAEKAKLDELFKSEVKYRGLFENSLAGIMTFYVDTWIILNSNRAIWQIFGCSSQDELRRCVLNLPPESLRKIWDALLRGQSVDNEEIQTKRANGDELWVLFSAQGMESDTLAQAVVVDITARKQSEEKIKQQSDLLDQSQDAIMVIDCSGHIRYWNSGATLTYEWNQEEAIGRPLIDLIYDDSRKADFHSSMEDIRHFNEWNGEQYHTRKDGTEILVESRWKIVRARPNSEGLVMIVNSDITEKRRLELQSIRAQRMESIGLLAGGLAHDLQNILTPVKMSIDMLREDSTPESRKKLLDAVDERAQSGLDLVKNILTYGKGISGERVTVNVVDIVEEVLSIISEGGSDRIKVKRHFTIARGEVLGDHSQLKQVFMNLCVNARDAMTNGGVLTVDVAMVDSDEALLDQLPSAEGVSHVVVSISDTGKGISESDLDKIFEPFFTTRESSGGTGLGLSIVQGIVRSHKGLVTVESKLEKGTTFRVYLPVLPKVVSRTKSFGGPHEAKTRTD